MIRFFADDTRMIRNERASPGYRCRCGGGQMFARFETPDTPTVHRGPPFANEQPESGDTRARRVRFYPTFAPISFPRRSRTRAVLTTTIPILVIPLSFVSQHFRGRRGSPLGYPRVDVPGGEVRAHQGRARTRRLARFANGGDGVGRYHLAGVSHGGLGTTSGRYCAMCVMNEEQSRVVSHPTNARRVGEGE